MAWVSQQHRCQCRLTVVDSIDRAFWVECCCGVLLWDYMPSEDVERELYMVRHFTFKQVIMFFSLKAILRYDLTLLSISTVAWSIWFERSIN